MRSIPFLLLLFSNVWVSSVAVLSERVESHELMLVYFRDILLS